MTMKTMSILWVVYLFIIACGGSEKKDDAEVVPRSREKGLLNNADEAGDSIKNNLYKEREEVRKRIEKEEEEIKITREGGLHIVCSGEKKILTKEELYSITINGGIKKITKKDIKYPSLDSRIDLGFSRILHPYKFLVDTKEIKNLPSHLCTLDCEIVEEEDFIFRDLRFELQEEYHEVTYPDGRLVYFNDEEIAALYMKPFFDFDAGSKRINKSRVYLLQNTCEFILPVEETSSRGDEVEGFSVANYRYKNGHYEREFVTVRGLRVVPRGGSGYSIFDAIRKSNFWPAPTIVPLQMIRSTEGDALEALWENKLSGERKWFPLPAYSDDSIEIKRKWEPVKSTLTYHLAFDDRHFLFEDCNLYKMRKRDVESRISSKPVCTEGCGYKSPTP